MIGKSVVNHVDSEQYTPLHWAALENLQQIAELLIESGANVDASENTLGQSPSVSKYLTDIELTHLIFSIGQLSMVTH